MGMNRTTTGCTPPMMWSGTRFVQRYRNNETVAKSGDRVRRCLICSSLRQSFVIRENSCRVRESGYAWIIGGRPGAFRVTGPFTDYQ
jgi:hypothetical protein